MLWFEINRNHHKTKRRLRYQTCKIFHNFCVCSFFSSSSSSPSSSSFESLSRSLIPLKWDTPNQILKTKLMAWCPFTSRKWEETKKKNYKELFIEKVIRFQWLRSALFLLWHLIFCSFSLVCFYGDAWVLFFLSLRFSFAFVFALFIHSHATTLRKR